MRPFGSLAGSLLIAILTCSLLLQFCSGSNGGAATGGIAGGVQGPREQVDVSIPAQSGETIVVPAGGDLQAAIDRAKPGDTITLAAGTIYSGQFTLPAKEGNGWVVIRTSMPDRSFPPPRTRASPSEARLMPRVQAPAGSVFTALPGSHHYRFVGLEIAPSPDVFLFNVVAIGTNESDASNLPHHFVFDRCYVHGDPGSGSRRGFALNSAHTAVIDSWVSDFKERGADSQAIAGWNGSGPFLIENNYLEGSAENIMFGGADPSIPNLVPSDITIRRNTVRKPTVWRSEGWSVKNLFELKNARRVLIEGNVFENTWNGFAILFTVRNQNGSAPWSAVEDVRFENNIVRHAGGGVNVLGTDGTHPSQRTRRLLVANNLFNDISGERWGGDGRLFQMLSGAHEVTIVHNTGIHDGSVIVAAGAPSGEFVFRDNLQPHNSFGIHGDDKGVGNDSIDFYFPGARVENNVLIGPYPTPGGALISSYSRYADNFFPQSVGEVGFVDPANGNYRLRPDSPFRGAGTDGIDVGADFDAIAAAMGGAS